MRRLVLLSAVLLFGAACAGPNLRRFPLAEPMRRDDDMRPLARAPEEYESSDVWDFVDQSFFRPVTRALLIETGREAINVNAMDEVPDSSWFTNRLGLGNFTPEQTAQGSCTTPPLDPAGPWVITSAKPNGINPGFFVRGPDGRRYLLKPDGEQQPERGSATDAIAARIYHALGYNTPCNRVVVFDRSILRIGPGASYRDEVGRRRTMSFEQVEPVLRAATRLPDGRYRMGASLFIEGEPLGPFTYQGLREDDPNDVVPHEDRRELRGARLVAAWLNHYDAREQNTFTSFIRVEGRRGYVRHWLMDFSDSFGQTWLWDEVTRRSGHAYPVDFGQIGEDLLTFGLIRRPWDHARVDPEGWIFGYYGAEDFDPEAWRGISPNPAFMRMTERDGAWMARILARFTDAHVRAVVATGELSYPPWARYLERTLGARRDRILARYLTRLSPLADAAVVGNRLCALDLATAAGVRPPVAYRAVRYHGARLDRRNALAVERVEPARPCVLLPDHVAPDGGPPDADPARYVVVDLVGAARGRAPLRAHLYDLGPRRGWRLVGLERPGDDDPPRG